MLYKANKNLIDNSIEENNIKNIVIKNYLPIRYNSKEMTINKKIEKLKEKLHTMNISNEEYIKYETEINNLLYENDRIQRNIVNKYLRIFRRMEYKFSNVSITSYPYELDNNMHIRLSEYKDYNQDHILNEVYENTKFINNSKYK